MNLLDKASIILTPSAYNNGEALCVKPSDGSGDFDFSRNSAATRVNAQGLVEDVQILSSNLVQNGDFSEQGAEEVSNGSFSQQGSELVTNGDFSDGTNGWINGNSNLSVVDGKLKILATAPFSYARQNIAVVSGKTYKITANFFYNSLVGNIEVYDGTTNTLSEQLSEDGLITLYVTSGSTNLRLTLLNRNGVSGDFNYWDNVSVVEVGQDWTLETGWSIGEDKAVSDGSGSVPNTDLVQSSVFTNGNTYKISLKIEDYVSGRLELQNNTTDFPQANGTHTMYFVAGSGTAIVLRSRGFIGSITNISVKEVGQNWDLIGTATITENQANIVTTSAVTGISQTNILTIGESYKITYNIVSNSNGGLKISGNEIPSVVGNNTYYFTASATALEILRNSGATDITITNISVIEITDDTNLPRINYEGFSYQDALGSEEIVNGTFDENVNGWVVNNANATFVWQPDKTALFTSTSFGYVRVFPSLNLNAAIYKVSFDILSFDGTLSNVHIGLGTNGNVISAIGSYTYFYTSTGGSTEFQIRPNSGGTGSIKIDNISVKEYLGQEVVPDSGCGSWLWEPQTTQLIPYSEDFSQWTTGGDTAIESGFLAPDGTNNAYKVSGTSSALTLPSSLSTTTTRSIYARTVSGTGQANLCSFNSNTNNLFTITEQWQRFDVNSANATGVTSFYAVDFRGATNLSEIILWGANATNDQDYATSYIPSNGTTVTRNQDVCINGGSVSTINSTEGVLYAEIAALANDQSERQISIDDGSGSNRIILRYNSTSNNINAYLFNGSVQGGEFNHTLSDITSFIKVGFKWKANDFALWVNGVEVGSDSSGTSFSADILNDISFDFNGAFPFYGKTKCLAVWKEALSDEELTLLTTI